MSTTLVIVNRSDIQTSGAGWHGRRAFVTGANGGIGFCVALELARKGAQVVLACRDAERGEAAIERISAQVPGALVELSLVDLASLASVRAAAERELSSGEPLHLLINNAGVMSPPRRLQTFDGFELQFGTNVLGPFLLTALLLPALERAGNARVVTVASVAHRRGEIRFDDPQWTRDYSPRAAYAQSKLANLMLALECQERLRQAGSTVASIACHPGVASTNLFVTGDYGLIERLARAIATQLIRLFLNTASQGALPVLFAATSEQAVGGQYYGPRGFREMRGATVGLAEIRPQALERQARARLWSLCEQLTGQTFL